MLRLSFNHTCIPLTVALLTAFGTTRAGAAQVQKSFFVNPTGSNDNPGTTREAPFRTLDYARQVVRYFNGNMTGDIVVNLAGGTYNLSDSQALVFGAADSGTNGYRVYYRADPNATSEPVISLGKRIDTQWSQTNLGDSAHPIYKSDLIDLPAIRQLYVNGVRAQRAHTEWELSDVVGMPYLENCSAQCEAFKAEVGIWTSQLPSTLVGSTDVELHWYSLWRDASAKITGITGNAYDGYRLIGDSNYCNFFYGVHRFYGDDPLSENKYSHVTVENSLGLLDRLGEFYFEKVKGVNNMPPAGYLHYVPRSGEVLPTGEFIAEVIAPGVDSSGREKLIEIVGARNITFYGLTFAHATWLKPESDGWSISQAGYLNSHSCKQDASCPDPGIGYKVEFLMPGAVTVKQAEGIRFEGCTFKHMGSNALNFEDGVVNSDIIGNQFTDISAGAISVGRRYGEIVGTCADCGTSSSPDRYINISNNFIDSIGTEMWGSPAITAYSGKNLNISHNDIHNVPYSGISVGMSLNEENPSCPQSCYCQNIQVNYNWIQDYNRRVEDGGGLYFNGSMTNTRAEANYISTGHHREGGIYADNLVNDLTLQYNVVVDNALCSEHPKCSSPPPLPCNPVPVREWLRVNTDALRGDQVHSNYTDLSTVTPPNAVTEPFHSEFRAWDELTRVTPPPTLFTNVLRLAGVEASYFNTLPATIFKIDNDDALALDRSRGVVASSVAGESWVPENLVDGSWGTSWSSQWKGANTGPEWVTLKLPGNPHQSNYREVKGVALRPRSGGLAFPVNYKIQYSDDALDSNWLDALIVNDQHPQSNAWIKHMFPSPVLTRYIRLYFTGFSGDDTGALYAQLAEFAPIIVDASPQPALWLIADDDLIAKNADAYVKVWGDESGYANNASQQTLAAQPRLFENAVNTRRALSFEFDDSMTVPGLTGPMNAFTLSFVIQPRPLPAQYGDVFGASGGWNQFVFHGADDGTIYVGTSVSSRITTAPGTLVPGEKQLYTFRFNNGAAGLYRNGQLINGVQNMTLPQDWTGFSISEVDGLVPEVILYKSALDDTELAVLHAHLNGKYRIW